MIAFDANLLSIALCPASGVAIDPQTKLRIERPTDRVNLLIVELDARKEEILIPMPALAEFLVMVESSAPQYLAQIHKLPRFQLGDFNEKSAIEVSQAIRKALNSLGKDKRDSVQSTWAKVNFDRQIVAIAKAAGCSKIYSTDGDVKKHAEKMGLVCIHLAELPLPPDPPIDPQFPLPWAPTGEDPPKESSRSLRVAEPAKPPVAIDAPPTQHASTPATKNTPNLSADRNEE